MTHRVYKDVGKHRYAYEYESYWDAKLGRTRQRMVRYLGPCDKRGNILEEPKVRLEGVHSSVPVGRMLVFLAAAEQLKVQERAQRVLGLSRDKAGLFVTFVLNQATDRVPDSHLQEWVEAGPLPRLLALDPKGVTPDTIDAVWSALCCLTKGKVWKDQGAVLQADLTRAWRSQTRESPGAYYDITKQAFYGWANPYAQKGHDANGGISTVVGFGMVVSEGYHLPYLCRALPGNQHDSMGVGETVQMLRTQGYERLRMVMDRGMISKENVEAARRAKYHLVGLVKGWDTETVALASLWSEKELEVSENVVKTSRGMVFARALTTSLFDVPRLQVAVVVNLHRKTEEREGRELALRELEGPVPKKRVEELKQELKVQDPRKRKNGKYTPGLLVRSPGRRGFEVDPKAVEQDRAMDGRFLIFSTDLSLDGPAMYRTYFARDGVEKVFRTGKGELNLGPLRHRRRDRMDAYATVFYTASLLWSWSERTLERKHPEMGLSEALDSLENVSWVRFGAGKRVREWSTRLNPEQKRILSALGATRYLPAT